jgi:hypothetical protein
VPVEIIQLVQAMGWPWYAAAFFVVCLGTWRVLTWVGREILIPWRDRHFAFLSSIEQTMKCQGATLSELAKLSARHDSTLDALWLSVEALHKREAA